MIRNSKVLVTGITGNVGGAVADALLGDHEVWALARFTRPGQLEHWRSKGIRTVVGDLAVDDLDTLDPQGFDYVAHLAANTAPACIRDTLRDNAEGVGVLMAHCRDAKAFLHVSAAGVYTPSSDWRHQYKESDPVGSADNTLYTGSKVAGEGAALTMARVLDLPTVICRLGHQYGNDKDGGLPGIVLRMMLAGQPIPLRRARRDADVAHRQRRRRPLRGAVDRRGLGAGAHPQLGGRRGGVGAGDDRPPRRARGDRSGLHRFHERLAVGTTVDPEERLAVTGPCQQSWRRRSRTMHAALTAS